MNFNDILSKILNNKYFIGLILLLVIIFTVISIYYYKNYVQPTIEDKYVKNKEFVNKNENKTDDITLYLFYTDWCPHCKKAHPEWEKFKEKTGSVFKDYKIIFREINCDTDTETADQFNITGYPTIKLVFNNKIYDYDAKPSSESLIEFLKSVIN